MKTKLDIVIDRLMICAVGAGLSIAIGGALFLLLGILSALSY